jgi:hypothetical protein
MARADSNALVEATVAGTLAQLAMVVSGHYVPAIANLFAVGGMAISALAGVLYARRAAPATRGLAARGGAIAGGVSALLGIIVSYALGDVQAVILAFGTLSSTVTGALGGLLAGRSVQPRA